MSIVIAVQNSTQIVLGADSMWAKGTAVVEGPPKIIEKEGSYLGFAGSLRVFNIVEKWFNTYHKTMNISKLYGSLKANGLIHEGRMPYSECQFIVAKPSGIWHIDRDLSIAKIEGNHVSCGTGSDFADGYWANRSPRLTPYDNGFEDDGDWCPATEMAKIIGAVCRHDTQCGGCPQIITIQKETQHNKEQS